MMGLVARLELAHWRRNRALWRPLLATALAVLAAAVWATAEDAAQREAHREAANEARGQWEAQGAKHPHGMAHFGDFAFRPAGPLARLDRGVQARLGKVIFMEGHRQGAPMHADVARAGTVARFPRPDAAFLLHTLVPLLLVFLGGAGLARDRESGRLKLALVHGARAHAVLGGHTLALWGLGLALLGLGVVAALDTNVECGDPAHAAIERLPAFVVLHALFLALVAAGVVAATAWLPSARAALLTLLAAWVLGTALLPRAAAGVADAWFPLPSQDDFQAQLRASREAGPDGHDPRDAFIATRREAMLREHGVDTVEALPLNFDGIAMQLDEEFGNRVWDEHYGALSHQLARQVRAVSLAALVNPFQAIDNLSMTLAGTDLAHDLAFQEQAEAHRRELIAKLNHEHAYGGSRTGDWSAEASAEFLAALGGFTYRVPPLAEALRGRVAELVALTFWALLLLALQRRAARRLERGTLAC